MVGLGFEGLLKDKNGVSEAVALEMFVDLLDGVFDKSVSFAFLMHALDDKVDFLLILAGRIILAIDGVLKPGVFLI